MVDGAGRNEDQPFHSRLKRLLGMPGADEFMQDDAAIAVNGIGDLLTRGAQRRDGDLHLLLEAGRDLLGKPHVGRMGGVVHGQRIDPDVGMRGAVGGKVVGDAGEPCIAEFPWARRGPGRSRRGGPALRDHEVGVADGEHRHRDDGQRKRLQDGRQIAVRRRHASRCRMELGRAADAPRQHRSSVRPRQRNGVVDHVDPQRSCHLAVSHRSRRAARARFQQRSPMRNS